MSQVRLVREASAQGGTFGRLAVDGWPVCRTLEDEIREIPGVPVAQWKVPGQTAIPAGTYILRWTPSARFQRHTWQILDVPGFAGIRIHAGNFVEDTEGCPLVGGARSPVGARRPGIGRSREALTGFHATLDPQQDHRIVVTNP